MANQRTQSRIAYFKAPVSHFNFESFSTADTDKSSGIKDEYTALVAVEGSFADSNDVMHEFSPERLETIANHTNLACDAGTIVPVCADHQKNIPNVMGSITGRAFTKVLTAEDLPNANSTHLIGKLGLLINGVKVTAEKGIAALRSGIKSVSMGLNLDPNEHRIMELSLVPIPAIPNMGLFHKKMVSRIAKKTANFAGIPSTTGALTWEEIEANEQSLDDVKEEYDHLTEILWNLLQNVYNDPNIEVDSPEVLMQIVMSNLNGFSLKVIDLLGLTSLMEQMNGEMASQEAAGAPVSPQDMAEQKAGQSQEMAENGKPAAVYSRSVRRIATFRKALELAFNLK